MMKIYIPIFILSFFVSIHMGGVLAQNDSDSLLQVIKAESDPKKRLQKRIKALEGWVVSDPALAERQLGVAMAQARKNA